MELNKAFEERELLLQPEPVVPCSMQLHEVDARWRGQFGSRRWLLGQELNTRARGTNEYIGETHEAKMFKWIRNFLVELPS